MEAASNTITIVTVCNNHYAVMLTALIKSIELNHTSDGIIAIYIVEDRIQASGKLKITESLNSKNITLHWLKMQDVIPKDASLPLDTSTFPLNVYVRLFIPYFLPQSCTKAIYLDVDMIVTKDLSLLWNTDIKGHLIAGVVDRSEKVSSTWAGITNYKELGLNGDTKYFNSGLLVIDLEKWRKTNLPEEILKCISDNKKYAGFPDQYGLNVVLANQWFELDKRWNTYAQLDEKNPFIIHFTGRKPIYSAYENNPEYKEIFFHYLKLTKWADFKPLKEYNRFINKLFHKLKKKVLSLRH